MKPIAMDLFCKAGGATKGLQRAGFYVIGVDIEPQPHYCGDEFIQGDALTVPLCGDFIWASPPCQKNVKGLAAVNVSRGRAVDHHDLIPLVREKVKDRLYVIENVVGAALVQPIILCGSMFGLPLRRHRQFECSFAILAPTCAHSIERKYGSNWRPNGRRVKACAVQVYGTPARGEWPNWKAAMQIDWMTREELSQAIPPAYSEYIGRFAKQYLKCSTPTESNPSPSTTSAEV